jgi:NADPH-dependent 2,4-dienoyl-CoA reductase/sulfur reductase-like enzyme
LVVIGNGVAGITAALRVRKKKRDWRITVVSGESDHFYSRPALMYIYMGHLRYQDTKPYEDPFWEANRIERLRGWVTSIDTRAKRLEIADRPPLPYDKLLIAVGSRYNKFGWPGQDLEGVQGLYGLQDLELLERNSVGLRQAVIVGGGLIGIELAEMLLSRNVAVVFLVREASFWDIALPGEESAMVNRTIVAHGIDLRLNTELREIVDDGRGRACAVVTSKGERIECQLVGLTAGVSPNHAVVKGSEIATGRGILVDESFRTNVPDVFAAGDCAEIVRSEGGPGRVEQLWYTAKMHGEVVGDVIAGDERSYDRGVWFNSAKFLDLEWQTYGQVPPDARRPPEQKHLWWEHPSGRQGLRVVLENGAVVGMNTIGIRQRHRVWEEWISKRRPIDYVLAHLRTAGFDPEFSRRYERDIVARFEEALR